MISVRPSRVTDIGPIASDLREIDRLECSVTNLTPKEAMRLGVFNGTAWTICDGRKRLMIFGVMDASLVEGKGRAWALATKSAEARWRQLLPFGEIILAELMNKYRVIENFVHADNAKAIRWLLWSGFTVSEPEEIRGHQMRKLTLCADL